jgi:transcriptional regulatory protein LEU3
LGSGIDLRYAPHYISQMILAAAVALLKLLHSFFAELVDRDAGEQLFWEAIQAMRATSVTTNDMPQRLAEVFAQMWKADAERIENEYASDRSKISDPPGSALMLKRRYRMSMSHVFDSIWRWKDELEGKVRAEKLETAVQNPTSPHATSHRNSFSNNGRRPSSSMMDENTTLPGMTSFGGFGGLTLGANNDMAYANSYEFFDPVGWYLDGLFEPSGMEFQ